MPAHSTRGRIETANALSLPDLTDKYHLPKFPQPFEHPSLPRPRLISLVSSSAISAADRNACFALVHVTSAEDYAASSIGWHPARKRREMQLPDLRYLLVKHADNATLEAFCSFMLTYEDGHEVVYCYEIHMDEGLRAKGLGRQLVEYMEDVGWKVGVKKSMLTVFVANVSARKFYNGLGYVVDENSPEERRLRNGVVKQPDYVILSKPLD